MPWLFVAAVAVVVAVVFDPRWVLAPLLGLSVYKAGMAMLRSMAGNRPVAGPPEPVLDHPERTLYWCEQCGTELLLVVRGTQAAPRHCGERMLERVEVVRG